LGSKKSALPSSFNVITLIYGESISNQKIEACLYWWWKPQGLAVIFSHHQVYVKRRREGTFFDGGLNQILKRQTSRSHYGSKVPAVTITVFKYRNKIGKIVVKAVPYSVT
jgi:hypothetical protein